MSPMQPTNFVRENTGTLRWMREELEGENTAECLLAVATYSLSPHIISKSVPIPSKGVDVIGAEKYLIEV